MRRFFIFLSCVFCLFSSVRAQESVDYSGELEQLVFLLNNIYRSLYCSSTTNNQNMAVGYNNYYLNRIWQNGGYCIPQLITTQGMGEFMDLYQFDPFQVLNEPSVGKVSEFYSSWDFLTWNTVAHGFRDMANPFFLWTTNNVAYYYPEFLSQQEQQTETLSYIYSYLQTMAGGSSVDYSSALSSIASQLESIYSNNSTALSQLYYTLSSIDSKLSTQPDYTGVLADISTTLGRIDQYTALIESMMAHLDACLSGGAMSVSVMSIPQVDVEVTNPADLSTLETLLTSIKSTLEGLSSSTGEDYTDVLDSIDDTLLSLYDYVAVFGDWADDYDVSSHDDLAFTSTSGNVPYDLSTQQAFNENLTFSGNWLSDVFDLLVASVEQGEYRRVQLDFSNTNLVAILAALDATDRAESYSNDVSSSVSALSSDSSGVDSAVDSGVEKLNFSWPSITDVKSDVLSFSQVFKDNSSDTLPANIYLFSIPTISFKTTGGWELDTDNGVSINVNPYQDGIDSVFAYIRYFFSFVWWSLGALFVVSFSFYCFKFARLCVSLLFGSPVETTGYNEGGFLSTFSSWN